MNQLFSAYIFFIAMCMLMVVVLTILPNVMSPTKALGGIRLSDICNDSCSKYIKKKTLSTLDAWTYHTHCDVA